jgi:hypothetical protein
VFKHAHGCMLEHLWHRPCCVLLCCAVLCCAVLCCAVLCCAVLCCAVLCCATRNATACTNTAVNICRTVTCCCHALDGKKLPGPFASHTPGTPSTDHQCVRNEGIHTSYRLLECPRACTGTHGCKPQGLWRPPPQCPTPQGSSDTSGCSLRARHGSRCPGGTCHTRHPRNRACRTRRWCCPCSR